MKKLSLALDVRGTGDPEPRGTVTHKQQYAKACALLADAGAIDICFYGGKEDRSWLATEGLLSNGHFRKYQIPGRIEYAGAKLGLPPLPLLVGGYDLYQTFGTYVTSKPVKMIGTLVDFVPMRVPEHVSISQTMAQIKWCLWAEKQRQSRWIAISQQVKTDALLLARLHPEQVEVTHLCASGSTHTLHPSDRLAEILSNYGIASPYLLYVSTLNPRKNHQRLVEAWLKGDFANQGWNLVFVGKPAGNPLVASLQSGQVPGVKWLGYVSKSELSALYQAADACVYPSLYEGFGIPVADAVVAGKAILTSQRSPMAEIARDGALYVDPWDVEDMVHKLSCLINDAQLRMKLGKYNKQQRQRFSIERLADDLLAIYRKFRKERD